MNTTEIPQKAPENKSSLPTGDENIFISYSRRDQEIVRRLQEALHERGRSAWVDWKGIEPAIEWMEKIRHSIDITQVFVFVISPESVSSRVCMMEELAHALDSRKKIIPIVVRDFEEAEIPPAHLSAYQELGKLNYIFLRENDDFDASIEKIIIAVDTDYEHVRKHTEYLRLARSWKEGQLESLLLRGEQLERAESWLRGIGSTHPPASELHITFIEKSRVVHQERERKTAWIRRLVMAGMAILTALAIIGGWIAYEKQQLAEQKTEEALNLLWQNSYSAWAEAETAYSENRPDIALAYLAYGMRNMPKNTELVSFASSLLGDRNLPYRTLIFDLPVQAVAFGETEDDLIVTERVYDESLSLSRWNLATMEKLDEVGCNCTFRVNPS